MKKKADILNELTGLGSTLATQSTENVYTVPAGYFEGLATELLRKAKAADAASTTVELGLVSPVLSAVSRKTPYQAPAGYFESLADQILNRVREHADYQTADEELASLSPLLGSLKKEMPFTLPEGYFENLQVGAEKKPDASPAKLVSLTQRKWFRYAAAAVVTGLVVWGGLTVLGNKQVSNDPVAKVSKDIKNHRISAEDVEEFLDLTEALASIDVNTPVTQPAGTVSEEYLEDVPDSEIIDFLDQLPEELTNEKGILN